MCVACDLHVEYDVRMFNLIQNRTTIHYNFEQVRHYFSQVRSRMDARLRVLS